MAQLAMAAQGIITATAPPPTTSPKKPAKKRGNNGAIQPQTTKKKRTVTEKPKTAAAIASKRYVTLDAKNVFMEHNGYSQELRDQASIAEDLSVFQHRPPFSILKSQEGADALLLKDFAQFSLCGSTLAHLHSVTMLIEGWNKHNPTKTINIINAQNKNLKTPLILINEHFLAFLNEISDAPFIQEPSYKHIYIEFKYLPKLAQLLSVTLEQEFAALPASSFHEMATSPAKTETSPSSSSWKKATPSSIGTSLHSSFTAHSAPSSALVPSSSLSQATVASHNLEEGNITRP